MDRHCLVLVRGLCGSGKSALCRTWAERGPYYFGVLSTDDIAHQVNHPELSDEDEFNIVLDRIGAEIARRLTRGHLLVDAGLRDSEHIDRVLGPAGRHHGDPDVVLVRLTVAVEEAVRRKGDLPEARVRELHEKWQTHSIAEETVLPTDGLSEGEIARRFGAVLSKACGSTYLFTRPADSPDA